AVAAGGEEFGAGGDLGTALMRVERVEGDQPGIVHPGVPIGAELETAGLERRAIFVGLAAEPPRTRQFVAAGHEIVEEEAEPDHPPGPAAGRIGEDEEQRLDDVRRGGEHYLALSQALADQLELILLQVAQAAVDQFGGGGAGMAGEVVLLDQQHLQPAPGRVARDRAAIDAAADDEEIEGVHAGSITSCWPVQTQFSHLRVAVAARQWQRGPPRRLGGGRAESRSRDGAVTAKSAKSDLLNFLRSRKANPEKVGAVVPSGDSLARMITKGIDASHAPVIELG